MSRTEPTVLFVCSGCGDEYEVSARYARDVRRRGEEARCRWCRYPENRAPVSIVATDAERLFWLERFSDEDIADFACVLYNAPFRPEVVAARRAELLSQDIALAASSAA